ncbi:MAG: serine hydrolase [Verrucomicrobia bacterium]|nr:serine hydrolase [Verrucomicrobiota bacterium]
MLTKNTVRLFLVFVTLCSLNVSCSRKVDPGDQASALIRELMSESQAVGITVTVGVKGEIVWSQGFGYADLEQQVPVYPDRTRFRVGNVAKPMTALAVAQLYEQGLLDLDVPIQRYVQSFPKKEGTITTRLLAGHLGGIRHYQGNENLSYKRYETVLDGLAIFKDDELLHPPGSKYSYSSYGYNLISGMIENASGKSYLEYMDEHVFTALGMNHTEADNIYSIIPD